MNVLLGNQVLAIPALPAADWLAVLMSSDFDLFDIMELAGDEAVDTLLAGDIDLDDWGEVALEVISTVAARPYWIALRLIQVAKSVWDTLGPEMVTRIDAEKASLAAWLGVLLVVELEHVDPDHATMFISRIELPPEGEEMQPEALEMSASQFLSMR